MSAKPSSGLSPALLVVVGVLVVAAVAVAMVVMKKPAAEKEAENAQAAGSTKQSKSHRTSGSDYAERRSGTGKSETVREGSRPDHSFVSRHSGEELEAMFVRVSTQAREELKELRERHATAYDDPEERRAFGVKLSQITDPQERQRVLRERTEEMRRARAEVDAAKTVEDREREKELIALMQVQNLWRMSDFVGKNPQLKTRAEQFDEQLAAWVQDSETMDPETFHSSFNALRDSLNQLRQLNTNTSPQVNSKSTGQPAQ